MAVNVTDRRYCFPTRTAFVIESDDGGQFSR
jgi:hypothetical protein